MPMAITVKAVLAANKRKAQAEERSGVFIGNDAKRGWYYIM